MITRTLRLLPLAVLLLLLLSACGGQQAGLTGSSWPGITASEDAVYLAFGSHVYKIDPESGNELWRFPAQAQRSQSFYAPAAVTDDLVVVADYLGNVYGLDPESGNQAWTFAAPLKAKFIGGATISDEFVYIGSVAGVMYALDRNTGEMEWSFAAQRDIWSAPLLDDGTLYFSTLDRHLYALDAQTGNVDWQYPANDVTPEESPIGPMVGTPLLNDGMLYFGDFNNTARAFNIETEGLVWTYETTNWVWGTPLLDAETGMLFGADLDGNVFALSPENGDAEWTFTAEGPVVSTPVLAEYDGNPALFVTSGDSNVYILDPEDGSKLAEIDVTAEFQNSFLFVPTGTSVRPIPVYAAPVIIGDRLFVGTHEGPNPLMAYDIESLDRVWAFDPSAQ